MRRALSLVLGLLIVLATLAGVVAVDDRYGVFPVDDNLCVNTVIEIRENTGSSSSDDSEGWCTPEWECDEWSECRPDGLQIRSCTDKWDCDDHKKIPSLFKECKYEVTELNVDTDLFGADENVVPPIQIVPETSDANELTGAVTGNSGISSSMWLILLLLLIIGLYGIFVARKRK